MASLGSQTRADAKQAAKEAGERFKKKGPAARKRLDERAAKRKSAKPRAKPESLPSYPPSVKVGD